MPTCLPAPYFIPLAFPPPPPLYVVPPFPPLLWKLIAASNHLNPLTYPGCGGSFYEFYGAFNLTQWDWEARLDCSWTISNGGLSSAVLLISAHEVELRSCE